MESKQAIYQHALLAIGCPLIIDSRCRILKPDPPTLGEDHEEGMLIDVVVSTGIARGRIQIINQLCERLRLVEYLWLL